MSSGSLTTAAVVLAAGTGTRLRPLTDATPKALCPVNNVALLDHALTAVRKVTDAAAVNAHHHGRQIAEHVDGAGTFLSQEEEPLGTAGALGKLKPWIDGRSVLVHNADAWHLQDLRVLHDDWDGERVRLLVTPVGEPSDFGDKRFCGVSLLPWITVEPLQAVPSGLWEVSWRALWAQGQVELVEYPGPYFDCGTPATYLQANLTASGGSSVIGPGARVDGTVTRSVVWPGGYVGPNEHLVDSIRTENGVTVYAGQDGNS